MRKGRLQGQKKKIRHSRSGFCRLQSHRVQIPIYGPPSVFQFSKFRKPGCVFGKSSDDDDNEDDEDGGNSPESHSTDNLSRYCYRSYGIYKHFYPCTEAGE